ncbi:KIAA1161 [Bugula neritina]|uniref:KIAA1161 n=1 Tax=Bugula neritina TaxID=10212 RepID=A0A7J7IZV6_BUGNE|nr:KIAA1161 [Bugula neritina]
MFQGEIVWMPAQSDMSKSYFHPSEYIQHYVQVAVKADSLGRRQEVRVGCATQEAPILVRMLDRRSRWGIDNGLKTVIPTALTFGLLGYPFVLPDMIGGNAYEGVEVEQELFVRWLQVNIFLPAIQFSIPPWQFDERTVNYTIEMLNIRESKSSVFDQVSQEAVDFGWPMVRPLWWIAPNDSNCFTIDDEFLLGNDILVAPIVEKGARSRDIYLPNGKWQDMMNNREVQGGKWYREFDANLWELPYFLKV